MAGETTVNKNNSVLYTRNESIYEKIKRDIVFENINVVTPDGIADNMNVYISRGIIQEISEYPIRGMETYINAGKKYMIPGLIDLHSDAIEKAIQPRPSTIFPVDMAATEFDKTLAACGITMMFYCIAFVIMDNLKSSLRNNDQAAKLINELRGISPYLKAKTKIHLRFDILNMKAAGKVKELINQNKIDMLSFMDHTPMQGQFSNIKSYKKIMKALYNFSDSAIEEHLKFLYEARQSFCKNEITELAYLACMHNIPLASHDDDNLDKIDMVKELGATISEFPVNIESLKYASESGLYTVVGSPNIIKGGSHSDNLSARDAVESGFADIICSDYSPKSLFHSLFMLDKLGIIPLHEAVNMASLNPAKAIGLDSETGSIEKGKKADLLIVDLDNEIPRIVQTFIDGVEVYKTVI
jgi:alpha-D-ribose 1-methylphosphonate 5-triphosphate diphosphatase